MIFFPHFGFFQELKVVMLEDLAIHFKIKTQVNLLFDRQEVENVLCIQNQHGERICKKFVIIERKNNELTFWTKFYPKYCF